MQINTIMSIYFTISSYYYYFFCLLEKIGRKSTQFLNGIQTVYPYRYAIQGIPKNKDLFQTAPWTKKLYKDTVFSK